MSLWGKCRVWWLLGLSDRWYWVGSATKPDRRGLRFKTFSILSTFSKLQLSRGGAWLAGSPEIQILYSRKTIVLPIASRGLLSVVLRFSIQTVSPLPQNTLSGGLRSTLGGRKIPRPVLEEIKQKHLKTLMEIDAMVAIGYWTDSHTFTESRLWSEMWSIFSPNDFGPVSNGQNGVYNVFGVIFSSPTLSKQLCNSQNLCKRLETVASCDGGDRTGQRFDSRSFWTKKWRSFALLLAKND